MSCVCDVVWCGADDRVQYWFTYCTGPVDCDTEIFSHPSGSGSAAPQTLLQSQFIPQALTQQPHFTPQFAPQPLSSGYGQQPQPLRIAATTAPAAGGSVCPAIRFQQSATPTPGQGTRFVFQSADGTPLQRVDLHYGLNGAAKNSVNLRMKSVSPTQWEIVDQSLNLSPSAYDVRASDCSANL